MSNKYSNLSLSNTSYTNRDFQTIFPELLQTVSTLTSKWTPLESDTNESDPGIVLVKLLALIGDKLNYNIDKNVLECFPLSATQEGNVRQLYSQLGYNMRWYRSATTNVYMKYLNADEADDTVTIPAFTMVSDENNSIVYTLLGDADLNNDEDDFEVSDKDFPLDGSTVAFKAIQGVSFNYEINGETTIQAYHLDSDNRIYFSTRNIPENGVFITNVSDSGTNYGEWKRKDNLLTENLNNTFYSFGVSRDGLSCYVEFPEDAENIFKDGIKITYVKTQGADGNISTETLEKFYADLVVDGVTLNIDNVKMWNLEATDNGQNPETMDEAIKAYKKLVGTFDTLVTLRDYTNYLSANGEDFGISNGFACDRTNDVQSVYKIVTSDNDVNTWIPVVEQVESEDYYVKEGTEYVHATEPSMSAFDLKLYLFGRPTSVLTQDSYNATFDMLRYAKVGDVEYSDLDVIKSCIQDIKSISHDYAYILPTEDDSSHICLIKNKYPIVCKIYTRQKYETGTEAEIRTNIKLALFQQLNSQEIDFSENITADIISDIIKNADNRIKKVVVEDINYTTYAVCWDATNKEYIEVPLNGDDISSEDLYYKVTMKESVLTSSNPKIRKYKTSGQSYSVGDIVIFPLDDESDVGDPSYIDNYPAYEHSSRWKCIKNISAPAGKFKERHWEEIPVSVESSSIDQLQKAFDYTNYGKLTATLIEQDKWQISNIDGYFTDDQLSESYGVSVNSLFEGTTFNPESTNDCACAFKGDQIVFGPSKSLQCRDEIFTKSVLNGTTPIFEQSEEFDYTYNQSLEASDFSDGIYRQIKSVATSDSITFPNDTTTSGQVQLRQNESLQFLAPSLMDLASFSNYVKTCYKLNEDGAIKKNVARRLEEGEWVAFFWKDSDDDTLYTYRIYFGCDSESDSTKYWVCPTFEMTVGGSEPPSDSIAAFITSVKSKVTSINIASPTTTGVIPQSTSDEISTSMYAKNYLLSGTKEIKIKKKSQIELDSTFYCYWILGDQYLEHYIMFRPTSEDEVDEEGHLLPDYINPITGETDYSFHPSYQEYTLGTGEYFFYLKGSVSTIAILGAGSTITRKATKTDSTGQLVGFSHYWSAPTDATLDNIMENGSVVLKGVWQNPYSSEEDVTIVENQYITLGPKTYVQFLFKGEDESYTVDGTLTQIAKKIDDVLYWMSTDTARTTSTGTSIKDSLSNYDETKARALLSIDISSKERQVLYEDQHLILYDVDDEIITVKDKDYIEGGDIETDSSGRSFYPTVIQSSTAIAVDGTQTYQVTTLDDDDNIVYPSIFLYKEYQDNDNVVYATNGKAVITVDQIVAGTPRTKSLKFKIPPTKGTSESWDGRYLIKMSTSSTSLNSLVVKFNGECVKNLKEVEVTDFASINNNGKSCYFVIEVPSTSTEDELTFTVESSQSEGTINITLSNPFRYKPPTSMTHASFKKYMELISKFDTDGIFDYSYQIDDESLIDNPLAASSFFRSNHYLYDFVICQMQTVKDTNLSITGET